MRYFYDTEFIDNGRTIEQMQKSFGNSFSTVIARDRSVIVGTARALSDGVCNAYIVDMWTHTSYRRRGVGRRMLALLCATLEGQHVYLFTDDRQDFYLACGFRPRGAGMERVVGSWLRNASRDDTAG